MITKIKDKITYFESSYKSSINTYLRTNTRRDRDKVLRDKYKLEAYQEVEKMLSNE